jgi:hypothetical protein
MSLGVMSASSERLPCRISATKICRIHSCAQGSLIKPRGRLPDAVTVVMRGAYEVQLANGCTVRAMLSGRMMHHKIRVTVGRNAALWGEAEGADRQTPLNSRETDPERTSRHGSDRSARLT